MNNRITRYAKIIEIISISITAAIISFTSIEWLFGSTIIAPGLASSWISSAFTDQQALNPHLAQIPFAHRLLGLSVDMVTFMLLILGLLSIIRLMRLFQSGELFSVQVITQFKTLSKVALSWAVYAPIRYMLLST
ncbi:MAG TPA: hypothetical protein VFF04_00510, partial [Candidatus Babeliales bacterium]|nr:hypothetical protein [Candidatus Babeliales bacterium]